jgi:hypothetical protein
VIKLDRFLPSSVVWKQLEKLVVEIEGSRSRAEDAIKEIEGARERFRERDRPRSAH